MWVSSGMDILRTGNANKIYGSVVDGFDNFGLQIAIKEEPS
jgi:hypothetical protein